MKKNLRAAVVLPESYQSVAKSKTNYPVLYQLHDAYKKFSDWLKATPTVLSATVRPGDHGVEHGAMYLAARHPALYCAAGTMSGALDLNPVN